MYLKCDHCGGEFMIGKRLGGGYYVKAQNPEEPPLEIRLDGFFDKHELCGGRVDVFSLEYEHDREWDRKD